MSAKNFKPFFLNSNLSFGRAGGDTVENLLRPAAGNSGNSYITYALVKTVLGDFAGLSHIANVYEYDFSASARDAEFARAECTHVFLVLQDQIRIEESYGLRLPYENIVSFLKKCGKPVVIAGLGANSFGGFDPEFHKKLPPALVKFLREISGMCEKIGIRGEFTADVLAKLGISNFQIIGCPSFFETGPGRRVEKPPFGELNPVLTSPLVYRAENAPAVMQDFLEKRLIDLSVFGRIPDDCPREEFYRAARGNLQIFLNPESWKAFLKKIQLCARAESPRQHRRDKRRPPRRLHKHRLPRRGNVRLSENTAPCGRPACRLQAPRPRRAGIWGISQAGVRRLRRRSHERGVSRALRKLQKFHNVPKPSIPMRGMRERQHALRSEGSGAHRITREADRIQGAPLRRQKASKKEPLLTLSGAPNMDTPDKITAGDLEVCVLTFNRAPLLRQALESLLAQTARGFSVSVYDNASSDGTAETVEELRPRFGGNFRYVRHPKNIGADANFHAALAGASRKYAMFMHDDDLAHPEYVECAVAAINAFGNVAVLASNYSYMRIESGESIAWKNVSRKAFAFESRGDFAAYIFCDGRASYSSAIYRTADLRARNRPNIYGKIGDTPVMIDAAGGGKTVVLADKNLFVYRIHAGQDSKNTSNGPTREEIVNRNRLFREILMNGSPAHRFAYRISYAEWLSRHVKFAGADDRRKREFLASLTAGETAGMMSKAYSVPVAGEFLRGFIRVLRMLRKLVWRPENF